MTGVCSILLHAARRGDQHHQHERDGHVARHGRAPHWHLQVHQRRDAGSGEPAAVADQAAPPSQGPAQTASAYRPRAAPPTRPVGKLLSVGSY